LKKLIFGALIAIAGWKYYQGQYTSAVSYPADDSRRSRSAETFSLQPSRQTFTCDGRQHCSQMRSRAEAEYFIRHCPNTKMDGDGDGIPCENDTRF
jgi:hypothetical protein